MANILDHSITLGMGIEDLLKTHVPLKGGWHSDRLDEPLYPVGYIDLLTADPVRGQGYYRENHRGVISIYYRATKKEVISPYEAFTLLKQAHSLLQGGVPSPVPGFEVTQFSCGSMTPRNEDGVTWGRSFTFTAITHEVTNGRE